MIDAQHVLTQDDSAADRKAPFAFVGAIVFMVVVTLAFPLYQALTTGYVYYVNGPDETSYLQFDFSQAAQSVTRPGQFLVSFLHRLGLSGGWINVVLDAVALVAFPWLLHRLFRHLGWRPLPAGLAALIVMGLPMLLLTSNPMIRALDAWNQASGFIYWFNMPSIGTPPFLRSPEPQFSLMVLSAAMLIGLRWRSIWPVYVVLPFLYPFVAIPAAFLALACHLRKHWRPNWRLSTTGPLSASFVAVSVACWLYYALFVGEPMRNMLVSSHLPLISLTALAALAAYGALRRLIPERLRFFALGLAIAPAVACNQQLISGQIPQPDNFESYVGTLAFAGVVALATQEAARLRLAAMTVGLAVFLQATYMNVRENRAYFKMLPLTPALVTALREDPGHTVVNDVHLSSLLDLVHPRQAPTALAFERTFNPVGGRYVGEYRCVKRQVLAEQPNTPGFDWAFKFLDTSYMYGSQNYIKAHFGRKSSFVVLQNVEAAACDSPERLPLRYFLVR